MTSRQLRQTFLDFFAARGHAVIPSASLIPENDPTVLFTTAGMHPLIPYLMGEVHPLGRRLANFQKCVRTGDIDEVGDDRHLTFFEMLGNWSLGDYFKKEAIAWSFEFLTSRKGLSLPAHRLYVTIFAGDSDAPRDDESIARWREQFAAAGLSAEINSRIFAYPKEKNWWGPAGQTGPCGPDTEIFYDTLGQNDSKEHAPRWPSVDPCHPNCDCGRYIEIWNNVFMEYLKTGDGVFTPLRQKNVDTGMGLERILMVVQGKRTIFETDLFTSLLATIERLAGRSYDQDEKTKKISRVIADHSRSAVFIIGDRRGVLPSNEDQGYIARRLIRRAVRYGRQIGINRPFLAEIAEQVISDFSDFYPELAQNHQRITDALKVEEEKFGRTLERGLQEVMKIKASYNEQKIPGSVAFHLYETYGFPKELTEEVLGQKIVDQEFTNEFQKHQDLSRAGSQQKFAGGLADHSLEVTKLHTATHLLHEALRRVLGPRVEQRGSNITHERLRFDFSHGQKMTTVELRRVEQIVNEAIAAALPVNLEIMTTAEAKGLGAIGLFADTYSQIGDRVKIYTIGSEEKGYFSREICGGPHVENTQILGNFSIIKEEAVGSGLRRIKAILQS